MKIVHIIPGSGGTFYCQNCMRDNELIRSLRSLGNEVFMVPMYLPLNVGGRGLMGDTPVFYGAINIYLKEKLPFYRHAPMWLERLFDKETFLQLAAKRSESTRASGLEELTISMLDGEEGRQATELDHLIQYLKKEIKPDVVHLSNALLLGLARRLKLAASRYYAQLSEKKLNIPSQKIHVVYGGIDFTNYDVAPLTFNPPVIGYLCRMSEYFGLGIICDAFILLKQDPQFQNLKLYLMGGYTADDKGFINKMQKKFSRNGILNDVTIFENFDIEHRIKFLTSLSLLSVPVPGGEAFGAYQIEALAAGVPIVQPNVGGYPEFIEATGGGILYEPNDAKHLARALSSLLLNPDRIRQLGKNGRETVLKHYSMKNMAENIIKVYKSILNKK